MTLVLIGKFLVMAGLGGATGASLGQGDFVCGFSLAILNIGTWIVLMLQEERPIAGKGLTHKVSPFVFINTQFLLLGNGSQAGNIFCLNR